MRSMPLVWLVIPVFNTLFQIFIKYGAEGLGVTNGWGEWFAQSLSSPWIIAAIVVEILCFFVWMTVLAELDLAKAFPLSGISYVLIVASGWFIFGEPVAALQVVGGMLIMAGAWLIATASRDDEKLIPELPPTEIVQER